MEWNGTKNGIVNRISQKLVSPVQPYFSNDKSAKTRLLVKPLFKEVDSFS